jgi:NADPH-dependent 2,4-dienoyl-CoA reductase/sulfur reductase-like enzyme/rhodanese-related sulfurtransferase
MFERGADISFANCGLPYYVGGVIEQRKKLLVQTPKSMRSRFNIDVRTMSEVIKVKPADKKVEVKNLINDTVYEETYDYLILSPGAQPALHNIPGIEKSNVFVVRNVPDSDNIKQYIQSHQPSAAAVVGAGYIGLEMAEMLKESGLKVTIIEAADQILGALDPDMAAIVQDYIKKQGIDIILSDKVVAMEGAEQVEKVQLESGKTVAAGLIIMGTGVKPEVWLAQEAGLAIGSTGGILVNEYLQTSDPFIYAAGDAIQIKDFVTGDDSLVPLAGPANRQGWIVANNICGRQIKYTGSQGTSIVKIMDMVAGGTGQNEKQLKRKNIDYLFCHAHPFSHATYYPGSSQMTIKLLFTPGEGKILGAQVVGYDNVDKTIDVLATAIRAGMNVYDLLELELAYAPPFSSAKSPPNMVAYVAANILDGSIDCVRWEEVRDLLEEGTFLIDARMPREVEKGSVDGAHNIPVDDLRERLDELPKDREIAVFCQVGMRSYIANRILQQNGFKAKNISGGYRLYQYLKNSGLVE